MMQRTDEYITQKHIHIPWLSNHTLTLIILTADISYHQLYKYVQFHDVHPNLNITSEKHDTTFGIWKW
jgi:hypothetical protein